MNRRQVLAASALMLATILSTPRAWSHDAGHPVPSRPGDARTGDAILPQHGGEPAHAASHTPCARTAARQQCTGPSPQAAAPAATPGCVAQPG